MGDALACHCPKIGQSSESKILERNEHYMENLIYSITIKTIATVITILIMVAAFKLTK
ncbi:MAG: hypothetical protein VB064_15265 [Oscillospiraceae bacterium]|nr:hypothetical protein [Oscillospiraceae bacterium]